MADLEEFPRDHFPVTGGFLKAYRNAKSSESFTRALARTGFDFEEFRTERQASEQLQRELDQFLLLDKPPREDGTKDCPLYTKLPAEIRLLIFSYLTTSEEAIHLHPVKGNQKLGFRLSRCGDTLLNMETGNCSCERGYSFRTPSTAPPPYLTTELLLLSRATRREALDLIFTTNHFTFTSLRDLHAFSESFSRTTSKLQHIQIFERTSDGCHSSWFTQSLAETRKKIGHLQTLKLHLYLDSFSVHEIPYPDGFLQPFLPLYFAGPTTTAAATTDPPTPSSSASIGVPIPPAHVIITARATRLWSEPSTLGDTAEYVENKLRDVFAGKWPRLKDVPMAKKPPRRVPESERAPEVKRGLLILGD